MQDKQPTSMVWWAIIIIWEEENKLRKHWILSATKREKWIIMNSKKSWTICVSFKVLRESYIFLFLISINRLTFHLHSIPFPFSVLNCCFKAIYNNSLSTEEENNKKNAFLSIQIFFFGRLKHFQNSFLFPIFIFLFFITSIEPNSFFFLVCSCSVFRFNDKELL